MFNTDIQVLLEHHLLERIARDALWERIRIPLRVCAVRVLLERTRMEALVLVRNVHLASSVLMGNVCIVFYHVLPCLPPDILFLFCSTF